MSEAALHVWNCIARTEVQLFMECKVPREGIPKELMIILLHCLLDSHAGVCKIE